MFDFLEKLKLKWRPEEIQNDASVVEKNDFTSDLNDNDDIVAQALCDHLNEIQKWKDRLDSIDFLANQARKEFDDIKYSTTNESLMNAIISVDKGYKDTVDFQLAHKSMELLLEWYDVMALRTVTGVGNEQ